MEMPESKQPEPNADLYEAALWYLRSKAKNLATDEVQEFASWLQRSPENASALLRIAEAEGYCIPRGPIVRPLRLDRSDTWQSAKHRALSQSYYKHVKQQSLYPKIGLFVVALCGVAGWMFLDDVRLLRIAVVAFACVVGFRVGSGYFDNSESEVRDFVNFIVARRGDIDFTDRGGKRRPSLVAEPPPPKSTTPAAHASTGVLPE
jgi:hypothetical protein